MIGDHFYTILINEVIAAVGRYGYLDEGFAGYVFGIQIPGTIPLYRLLNPTNGDHFFTTSVSERDNAIANVGYQDEGIACFVYDAPAADTVPLYRLLNLTNGDHFYTISKAEYDEALSQTAPPPATIEDTFPSVTPVTPGTPLPVRPGFPTAQPIYQDEQIACYVHATQIAYTIPFHRLLQVEGNIPPRRIIGFADLHNHQFANLAFGGKAFVGAAFGPIDQVLPHCDYSPSNSLTNPDWVHGPGGTRDFLGTVRTITSHVGGVGHLVGGYPEFDGWPRWNNLTHQAVYQDWLWRAFQGGLKLLVVFAVNNEFSCATIEKAPGRSCDDMEAVDLQLAAAKEMERYIDEQSGGPGQGWYRVVYSPQQARNVINAGQLAVVLGTEVDFLFGCKPDTPLAPADLLQQLDHYYSLGVRHVFPIHFNDNAFGGTGFQNDLIGDPAVFELGPALAINHGEWPSAITTRDAAGEGYAYRGGRVNIHGLTELGKFLVKAMMSKGMIIDIDHMSAASARDTLDIAESLHYPIISSHTGFIEISQGDKLHEGNMKAEQVERIRRLGGMVALILWQGKWEEVKTWRGSGQTVVEHGSGGTSESWAQAYLYAIEKMQGGPVAFGTDFNGMISPTGPRFGLEAAPGGTPPGGFAGPTNLVNYPFRAIATGVELDRSVVGNKVFNINEDGLAHVGLLPDFIADLQQIGLSSHDLAPLLNSAEGYIQMWETAEYYKQAIPTPVAPFENAPTWGQRGGGFLRSSDNDLISYRVEPGAIGDDAVEFVLELPASLSWRKELILATDDGQWTIAVQDFIKRDQNGLYRYQLPTGRLLFRKQKSLLEGGDMRQVLELSQLYDLPLGARVTFNWIRD